ncbi:MAG: ATP-binding protein [Pseudomonadota bacterium]
MFFKRSTPAAKESRDTPAPSPAIASTPAAVAASTQAPLEVDKLRRRVDPASLGFGSTSDLMPATSLIGQDRALKAIEFGTSIRAFDFNLFVLGPPASGKSTAVRSFLERKAAAARAPDDWVYVNNFEDHNKPKALRLPAGRAKIFARAMLEAIDELRATLPAAFESEDYQVRRRAIDEQFRSGQEERFAALDRKAEEQNIAVLRTPMGFAMAPVVDGKVVKPEDFNQLPEDWRADVQRRIEELQKELVDILESAPRSDKRRRLEVSELNEEVAEIAIKAALDDVRALMPELPAVASHLTDTERDLVRNVALFLTPSGEEPQIVRQPVDTSRDPRFRRYMVNVVVAQDSNGDGKGAPIHSEANPTYGNLIGRIEHIAQMGTLVTDFLLIKPGALHRSNGGYLLVDARKILFSPFAWEALKRAIKSREIRVEQPIETLGFASTQTLDPEPIPLDVKVVLFGDRELYYLLNAYDEDFGRLFKVQADFDETIARSTENDRAYAGLIAAIVARHGLRPVDAGGVARIIEEGARLAEDREKLSIEIGRIADIMREADYWAGEAGRATTTAADVSRAVAEHVQRADRLRDRSQEIIAREIVLVDTEGAKVGQINGLSVIQLGDFAFGRPSRITARTRLGQGRVTDIEREAKLGGPLHTKGVMILWGFLAGRFALDIPLALAATLVFEQSYGGVEGDSASSAELYALLSALADAPIRQDLAVTGSVNQWGEVQAIGGVNEKIEGFFDVCKARGLTGTQGVLIPKANVQHLMLREDVVEAAAAGKFAVYPVATIDEGIELLTGIGAGARAADGLFPAGTINRRVDDCLKRYAEQAKGFRGAGSNDKDAIS